MSINLKTHEWAQSKNFSSHYFPETTSTNDIAKMEFPKLNRDFAIYLADHQSNGRGRYQRIWQNLSKGEILLSTWCFKSKKTLQPIFPSLVGLALYDSLLTLNRNLELRLKPPNDIYITNKKLAGLLIELTQQGNETFVYIGLGMNVHASPQVDLPTTYLDEHKSFENSDWKTFCFNLKNVMENAIVLGANTQLDALQIKKLKASINKGLPSEEQVIDISPHCDIITKTGQISWKDL